jgi:predicted HAD superfamily Cof-like phosphohydrolase
MYASNFELVENFMRSMKQEVKDRPSWPKGETQDLRVDLIREELNELEEAMSTGTLVDVADALTDILYVTYGAGHAFGINLDKCFEEVQNSNMTKLDESGKPVYNDKGKVIKGARYTAPDLDKILYD